MDLCLKDDQCRCAVRQASRRRRRVVQPSNDVRPCLKRASCDVSKCLRVAGTATYTRKDNNPEPWQIRDACCTNLKHGKPTEYDWDWPEDVVAGRRRSARRSVGRRGAAELEIGEAGGVV